MGRQYFFTVQHPTHFWPLLKVPAEKLVPNPQSVLNVGYIIWTKKYNFLFKKDDIAFGKNNKFLVIFKQFFS